MDALLRLAERLGVAVSYSALPGDMLGCWVPELGRVFIDPRQTPCERMATLAHELGHVHHMHPCTVDGEARARANERQADRFAARVLIDAKRYAQLEAINPDQHWLADELDVPVDLIYVYEQHCLTRVHGVTYAHAREGAGQWAFRSFSGEAVA